MGARTRDIGLVVQEMILRHRVRSVLIVCPSSLQVQWKEEMRDKFGLEFRPDIPKNQHMLMIAASCAPNRQAGNDARQILRRAPPAQTSRPGNLDLHRHRSPAR